MRAVVYDRWGGSEVLHLADLPMPEPKSDEVLIRVEAASLNPWDWDMMTGKPYFVKPSGFTKGPKLIGYDVAGIVAAVGTNAKRFKPGDAVFGDIAWRGPGTVAEYVVAEEASLVARPESIDEVTAAALPQAGMLAYQAMRQRPLAAGESMLFNGAGGGVGPIAMQLAKRAGAVVTGVDAAEKADAMRAAGADHSIDYRDEDFAASGRKYDLIIDVVADRPMGVYLRALNRGGRLVVVGGRPGALLRTVTVGVVRGLVSGRRMGLMIYKPNADDLAALARLVLDGEIAPVIDSVYPIERTAEAMRRLGAGEAIGKVVVTVPSPAA